MTKNETKCKYKNGVLEGEYIRNYKNGNIWGKYYYKNDKNKENILYHAN